MNISHHYSSSEVKGVDSIMQLSNIDIEQYLSHFVVSKQTTLFRPSREEIVRLIRMMRCPLCCNKIYWNLKGDKAFCKSKRKDGFLITREKYNKLR